jgi:dihydroorotate dehydrogenase (NAD+) catalytic subunit
MVRSCVDGPVFAGDRVRWDDVGTVPADAVGRGRAGRREHELHRPDPDRGARPAGIERRSVDLRTALGRGAAAEPGPHRLRLRRCRPRAPAFFDVSTLGAVVTKSILRDPRAGRPTPRMAETPSGMLNSIGLQGPGIDAFLRHDLPWLLDAGARAVVSIAGRQCRRVRRAGAAAGADRRRDRDRGQHLVSERRGSRPGVRVRPGRRRDVVAAVRAETDDRVPVLAKLSPGRHRHRRDRQACVDAAPTDSR